MGVASFEGGTLVTLWKVTKAASSDFTAHPRGLFGDLKKGVIDVWAGRWFALRECFGMEGGNLFCKGLDKTVLGFAGHVSFLLCIVLFTTF